MINRRKLLQGVSVGTGGLLFAPMLQSMAAKVEGNYTTPKRVIDRLEIETKIGPLVGFWRSTTLNGRRMYVVPRCYTDVIDADTDVDSA